MSAGSYSAEQPECRRLSAAEIRLVHRLLERAGLPRSLLKDDLRVGNLPDGGMGSFRFLLPGVPEQGRQMGRCAAQMSFRDADDVEVLASLDLDKDDHLFELDVWKVDFSPLIRLPEE